MGMTMKMKKKIKILEKKKMMKLQKKKMKDYCWKKKLIKKC